MNEKTDLKEPIKDKRKRSPNYPVLDLEHAIKRAEELYRHDRNHQVPIDLLHERWGGMSKLGGYLLQIVAALKAYGLIEVDGQKENRKIRISQVAVRIIEDAPDKEALIKKAAIEPIVYKEIWNKYQSVGLPKEDVLDRVLRWGEENIDIQVVSQKARNLLIKNFTETIKFAKLDVIGKVKPPKVDENEIASTQDDLVLTEIDKDQMNQTNDTLKPPVLSEEFATIQIPNIGILKIVYPITKKKLNIIKNILGAMDDDVESESSEKDNKNDQKRNN